MPQKLNTRRTRRQDLLPRNPIALRKHRAQALVARNNVPKRSLQRRYVQISTQPNRQRDRVARTPTFQPLQKPQPPLRIRQRHFRRTLNRTQSRTRHAAFPQTLNQPRHRRRFKQAADRKLNIKARTDAADQPRRQQRMTTKRKKVILNPNSLNPKNLRKQPAQKLLPRRARKTTNPRPKLRRR